MSLERIIHSRDKSTGENVMYINKLGRNRICVEMPTAWSANKFTNSEILKSEKLKAYVPRNLSRRVGVKRNVAVNILHKVIAYNLNVIGRESIYILKNGKETTR